MIPHGVPDISFRFPEEVPSGYRQLRRPCFVSAGLIRESKGIETALAAFQVLKNEGHDFTYIICGASHPRNITAAEYRWKLIGEVERMGLTDCVLFIDHYLQMPN